MSRIHLSPPDMGPDERTLLLEAFDSNWIAPLGPHVDAFEREVAERVGVADAAAVSSGTAALHLALLLLGVSPGDEVLVPSLTFVASANAVRYTGARPIFIDADPDTWCLDPDLVEKALADRCAAGRVPRAVMAVDVFGQCADYERLQALCDQYEIGLLEDSAAALGSERGGRAAGSFGRCGIFSLNGNKIITSGGGGVLVSDDRDLVRRARHLAAQAREPVEHYEHHEVGFNYRLSNLLAAVGRGQLRSLDARVARRRALKARYRELLGDLPGVGFQPDDPAGRPNAWLTVATFDRAVGAPGPDAVRRALEAADIESRPVWKPMHRQPVYADCEVVGGSVAERVFSLGLCLPSGSSLTDADQDRVVDVIRSLPWPG